MTEFQTVVETYYTSGYNCSETLVRAANEYYHLDLHDEDMKMISGFGGGMFVGSTCGALVGSVAALSKMVIKTKAHDQLDEIRPYTQKCVRNFKEELGNMDCAHVKPIHHTKETKCLNTCLLAAKALEKTILETVGE